MTRRQTHVAHERSACAVIDQIVGQSRTERTDRTVWVLDVLGTVVALRLVEWSQDRYQLLIDPQHPRLRRRYLRCDRLILSTTVQDALRRLKLQLMDLGPAQVQADVGR